MVNQEKWCYLFLRLCEGDEGWKRKPSRKWRSEETKGRSHYSLRSGHPQQEETEKNVWSTCFEECGKQLIIKERSAEWLRVQLGLECNLCWSHCWRTSLATFSSRLALTRVWPAPSGQGGNWRRGGWKNVDAGKPINTGASLLTCVVFLPAPPDFLATSCLSSGSCTHAVSSRSHLI